MKNYKNYTLIMVRILFVFVCISRNGYAQQNDTLKPLHDQIKANFINKSSAFVAQQQRVEKKNISDEFQQFLDSDELIQNIRRSYGDGTGEFSYKVVSKTREITADFQRKIDELNVENKWSITKEVLSKTGMVVSIILGIAGGTRLATGGELSKKPVAQALAGAGIVGGIGSWVIWSWSAQEQQEKQIHIVEAATMKEKWARGFIIKANK